MFENTVATTRLTDWLQDPLGMLLEGTCDHLIVWQVLDCFRKKQNLAAMPTEFVPFSVKLFKSCPQLTDKLHFHHGLIDCNGGVEILVGRLQHLTAAMIILDYHDHI